MEKKAIPDVSNKDGFDSIDSKDSIEKDNDGTNLFTKHFKVQGIHY